MLPGHSVSVCAYVHMQYICICLYSRGHFVVCNCIIFDIILCVFFLLYCSNFQILFSVTIFAVMFT